MAKKTMVPEAKTALERFKMEAAGEVGVNLKDGYNGDLTSKQAGSVGGQENDRARRKEHEITPDHSDRKDKSPGFPPDFFLICL